MTPSTDEHNSKLAIKHDLVVHLNGPALEAFDVALEQYAIDVLDEAGRLEATAKSTKGTPEITSSMVRDAELLIRRGYSPKRKKPLIIVSQILATIGGFLTGLLADMEMLKNPLLLVAFVIVLTVAITATVVTVMKE